MKRIIGITVIFVCIMLTNNLSGANGLSGDSSNRSLASLIYGLQNGNKGLMISCALTIGEYRFEEATDVLSGIIKSSDDADVKFAAIVALYKIKTGASIKALKSAVANQEDPSLKEIAEVLFTDIMRNEDAEGEYEYTAK